MYLSIIIPAYNEEKRIESTLKHYSSFFGSKNIKYEIIVVCNGCKDNTVMIVNNLIKDNKNIRLLNYEEKIGKGGAVLEGLKQASGDYVGFVDADDAFDLEILYLNITKFFEEYDCVIASKWINKNFFDVTEGVMRKVLSRGWNVLIRILLGLKLKDTQGGAKFMNRKALDSINLNFECNGFEFDVELLLRLSKKGNSIKEVYIPSKDVEGSKFNNKHIPSMFLNLLKLWRIKSGL